MKMKFSSLERKMITINSNQKAAWKCYESTLKNKRSFNSATISHEGKVVEVLEVGIGHKQRSGPVGDVQEREFEGKLFELGASLGQELQDQIARVIARHLNAFAWSSVDMRGIDPDFLYHRLTIDSRVRPVVQRRRKFNEDRHLIIKTEIQIE